MTQDKDFLGRGWGFPPTFTDQARGVGMSSGQEDIEASLKILLSTRLDERVMRLDYGCQLDRLLFEPITTNLITQMKDLIYYAILHYEPRVKLQGINFDSSRQLEGVILISLDYEIISTNSRYNYVYPFYLNEGTNLEL